MAGTWHPVGRPDFLRPARFDCVAEAPRAVRYLRDGEMHLSGTVRIEGLAGLAPCEGSLAALLPVRRRLRYQLRFLGDDGRAYSLEGEKRVRYLDFVRTMTRLP